MTIEPQDVDPLADDLLPDSASLVDSETTVQTLLLCTDAQQSIHRRTENQRCRLICAFTRSSDAGLQKRAVRLADCCKWPLLYVDGAGEVKTSLQRCRDRLCPVCSAIKGRQLAARFKDQVQMMKSVRFATLTGQSTGRSLKEANDHIQSSFRALRRDPVWKEHVKGGLWSLEVKPGRKEGTWNVHLHMLIDGKFFDQRSLSEAWLRATGDSPVVDIRKVHSIDGVAHYVTKYIAKPGDFERFSDDELCIFAAAIKGRRMFGAFGNIKASRLEVGEEHAESTATSSTVSAHTICRMADAGHANSIRARDLLVMAGGYFACLGGAGWTKRSPEFDNEGRKELARLVVSIAAEIERESWMHAASPISPRWTPPPPPEQFIIDDWIDPKLMC